MKRNKLFVSLFSLATLSLLLVGCNVIGERNSLSAQKKENIEALTSITFLESALNADQQSMVKRMINNASTLVYDEAKLQSILPTLDTLLNNGTSVQSSVAEEETIIGETTYTYKETLSFKDHNLEEANYTLVYNKVINEEKDDDEVETSEILNGYVLLSDDVKYSFESKSSSEKEEDESEFERSFHIKIDQNSYILVEEENEMETNETETEFSYTFVKDGQKEIEYSISIENKNEYFNEISYELNGTEYELTKVTKNGQELYQIEIENNQDEEAIVCYKKETSEEGIVTFVKVEK